MVRPCTGARHAFSQTHPHDATEPPPGPNPQSLQVIVCRGHRSPALPQLCLACLQQRPGLLHLTLKALPPPRLPLGGRALLRRRLLEGRGLALQKGPLRLRRTQTLAEPEDLRGQDPEEMASACSPCSDAQFNSQSPRPLSFLDFKIPYDQLQPYHSSHHPLLNVVQPRRPCVHHVALPPHPSDG